MNYNNTPEGINEYWQATLKKYEDDVRRAHHKRKAAAFTDFTKTLFSIIGRNKGLRYDVAGEPRSGVANEQYEKAQERYRNALIDYKGKIATLNLAPDNDDKQLKFASSSYINTPWFSKTQIGLVPQQNPIKTDVPKSPNYTGVPWHRNILSEIKNLKYPEWYTNINKKQ